MGSLHRQNLWRWSGKPRISSRKVVSEDAVHKATVGIDSLNPVLLIPGIGGSILNAISDKDGSVERIWVRLFMADREFRLKLWSLFNPATGKTHSLDPSSHIEVPEDNYGLYSCDILDPDVAVPLDAINYFHLMIVEMRKWGYTDGRTLFGFGYDFRQSNRLPETMERLRAKLKGIHDATGRKVDVVTHSMGGVLFKSFLALHHDDVASYVGKWVAIAAPFRGAPGFILDTLLTGVEFLKGWQKSLFIAKWSMHQLLVECPSVYELMADYGFEWEEAPELRLVLEKQTDAGTQADAEVEAPSDSARNWRWGRRGEKTAKDPPDVETRVCSNRKDVVAAMNDVLRENSITADGKTIPLPLNHHILDLAEETRRLLATAQLPESVEFFAVYGVSLDTPFHCQYGSREAPLKDVSDVLHTDAIFEFRDGDGTVPAQSAQGYGMPTVYRVGVPGEHRALLNDPRVHRMLHFFLRVPPFDGCYDPHTDCILVPSKEEVEAEMSEAAAATSAGGCSTKVVILERDCTDEESDIVEVLLSVMPEAE